MDRTLSASGSPSNGEVAQQLATPLLPQVMDVLDAAYHTAHGYEGGVAGLAARMHTRTARGELVPMNANTLQHKVNPNNHTHHVFLREGRDMMVLSDNYSILHALAADTGHVAIRVSLDCTGMTMQKVGVMVKEFSDVLEAVTQASTTNSDRGAGVSPNEMSRIEQEAAELIAALNCLVANMRAQMAEVR